jgi:hypothetical protein
MKVPVATEPKEVKTKELSTRRARRSSIASGLVRRELR